MKETTLYPTPKKYTKRLFVILIVNTIMFFVPVSAQESPNINNKWNIKIGYSRINNWPFQSGNIGDIRMEGNYIFLNYLDAGVYCGVTQTSTLRRYNSADGYTGRSYHNAPVLSYGINANIHILPFFVKTKGFRFDIYASLKAGGYYIMADDGYNPNGGGATCNLGGGAAFYIFKHMGVYGEYGYGFGEGVYRTVNGGWDNQSRDKNIDSFRFGLTFKF